MKVQLVQVGGEISSPGRRNSETRLSACAREKEKNISVIYRVSRIERHAIDLLINATEVDFTRV